MDEQQEANLVDFVTAIETACFDFKQTIAQKHGITDREAPAASEINFNLNFKEFTTQKLGTFEVTEKIPGHTNRQTINNKQRSDPVL